MKMPVLHRMKRSLLPLVLLVLSLPLAVYVVVQVQQYLTLARGVPANLSIDINAGRGPIRRPWLSFAQGGEEPPPMLAGVAGKLQEIQPSYIRLDHIYDYYGIVRKSGTGWEYDFSRLDATVDDIIRAGATPFFSLSYMPSSFTATGSVIEQPASWQDWEDLVAATVAHYSGKTGKNLRGVMYEVWNEPELPQFGSWRLAGAKDYRLLYQYAVRGATRAADVQPFSIGGPGVGSYYPDWINGFLSYTAQNNLRVDFYSWHRYHTDASIFATDAKNTRAILSRFPKYKGLPLVISEWGIDSRSTPIHATSLAAAHIVSSASQFSPFVHLAFSFEIKDGPPPQGGNWGLFTHERAEKPLSPKQKYYAFAALSKLEGTALTVNGQGTYVKAMSSTTENQTTVVIVNYDMRERNTENVPVTISGLTDALYDLEYQYPLTGETGHGEVVPSQGKYVRQFIMPPNSIIVMKLKKLADIAAFVDGVSGAGVDSALSMDGDASLQFRSPQFRLRPEGAVQFAIKPLWDTTDRATYLLLDMPFATLSGKLQRLFLEKRFAQTGNKLFFTLQTAESTSSVSLAIEDWVPNEWQRIAMGWNPTALWIEGKQGQVRTDVAGDYRNGDVLTFYPFPGAIDDLEVRLGDTYVLKRGFDGRVDQ